MRLLSQFSPDGFTTCLAGLNRNGRRNPISVTIMPDTSIASQVRASGPPLRRGQSGQYRGDLCHRAGAHPQLHRRGDRLYPRQQRALVDAGRARFDGPDAVEGPVRRKHHDQRDQCEGAGLFHRALHQYRRQVGLDQCDLHGQHQPGLDHPGQRIRRRHHRVHEGRRLPEHRFQHQFDLGLGQRADARGDGARRHRIDGAGRQDGRDEARRQEPDRSAQPRSPRRPATSTSRSFRSPRTSMSAPATTTQTWINWTDWEPSTASAAARLQADELLANGKTWTPANHNTWNGCVTDRDQNYDTHEHRRRPRRPRRPCSPPSNTYCKSTSAPICRLMPLSYDLDRAQDADRWHGADRQHQPGRSASRGDGMIAGTESARSMRPPRIRTTPTRRCIILMSDGLNTQNRWPLRQRPTQFNGQIDARQKILCDNIKAAGITIYTVQVNTGSQPIRPPRCCNTAPAAPTSSSW